MSVEELLPASRRAQAGDYVKGTDTMDVWFDSGSSWAGVLQHTQVVDYVKGTDAMDVWFDSGLWVGMLQ
eukprot:362751-Chlamydomonas_euryale.AAC.4